MAVDVHRRGRTRDAHGIRRAEGDDGLPQGRDVADPRGTHMAAGQDGHRGRGQGDRAQAQLHGRSQGSARVGLRGAVLRSGDGHLRAEPVVAVNRQGHGWPVEHTGRVHRPDSVHLCRGVRLVLEQALGPYERTRRSHLGGDVAGRHRSGRLRVPDPVQPSPGVGRDLRRRNGYLRGDLAVLELPAAALAGAAAASGIALINSLGNLGGFVSPYAVGVLQDKTGNSKSGC